MSETDNTGQVPSVGENNNANFVDVPIENESPSLPDNESNENLATSESVSTEPFATAEPSAETMAAPSINGESVAPSAMTKTGKPLSAKQTNLQRLRSETLADMREKYAERFAGYDKPPKAKAYHAAGLTTVRQRDGEAAYTAALKDIMDKNDPKLGTSGKSTFSTMRKSKKTSMNTTRNIIPKMNTVVNTVVNTVANRNATSRAIASIEDMGRTAKSIIDTIVQASKDMSRELGRSGNTTALKQLSTLKVKRGKKTKPLSTIYEGNNSTRNFGRNSLARNSLASNLANNSTPLNLR
jgi:hypothetical protein